MFFPALSSTFLLFFYFVHISLCSTFSYLFCFSFFLISVLSLQFLFFSSIHIFLLVLSTLFSPFYSSSVLTYHWLCFSYYCYFSSLIPYGSPNPPFPFFFLLYFTLYSNRLSRIHTVSRFVPSISLSPSLFPLSPSLINLPHPLIKTRRLARPSGEKIN